MRNSAAVRLLTSYFCRAARPSDVTDPSRHLPALGGTQKQERRPRLVAGSGVWTDGCLGVYFAILYVRSPAAFFDESIFCPPLLPRMLTNPRTVCFCQPAWLS